MKKLREKASFLTKIMLVIGLLISNLSSLSIVFAYEATGAVQITVVDEKLNIKYLDELAEEVENVNVNVYENYTYLDNTSYYVDGTSTEAGKISNYSLTTEELISSEGLEIASILSSIVFDGLYEVKVEITDTEGMKIDSAIYSENVTHESGLDIKVMDAALNEVVALENGSYSVSQDNSKINVVAKVLAGGLKPTDMFIYDEVEYMAAEVLELEFSSEMDFDGRLYGDYTVPVEVPLLNSSMEEVGYSSNLNIIYESYAMNTLVLNTATDMLGSGEEYEFAGDAKDGILYVLLNADKINTMLDLYQLMESIVGEDEVISYILSNSEYSDILASYDVNSGISLEDYLTNIKLDDTVLVTLVNEGLTITYSVVVAGDVNNDNVLNEEDLLGLIDQVIGNTEVNVEKSDLYELDGNVNTLDIMYLDQVIKNGTWDVELSESEATLEARLDVMSDNVVSGDEFTVNYVLTLSDYAVNGISGIFKYDENMFDLLSVETSNEWIGSNNKGKFLYLGDESLSAIVTEDENGEVVITPGEYVVVTATFLAKSAGTGSISVESPEYFDQDKYLVVEAVEIVAEVVVNASDNNNLSSLTVAGQAINLEDGILEYEITVSNDVTTAEVLYELENVAANVTSIVAPEELVEGTNTVTITVTSENGTEQVYTITVIREEAVEEETVTTPVNYTDNTYTNDTNDNEDVELDIPKSDSEEDDDEVEEESNLSRIIIIILILLVIAGLIYLIFKDEDDEETKKTNKEINKLKKEEIVSVSKNNNKPNNKTNNKSNNSKNKNTKNNKKER